jgi:hypothetical protein
MEGHGAFRIFDSAQQFGLVTSYRDFASSHAYLLDFRSMPTIHIACLPAPSGLLLHLRRKGVCLQGVLLNSLKHIPDNSITAHGLKVESLFPFHWQAAFEGNPGSL